MTTSPDPEAWSKKFMDQLPDRIRDFDGYRDHYTLQNDLRKLREYAEETDRDICLWPLNRIIEDLGFTMVEGWWVQDDDGQSHEERLISLAKDLKRDFLVETEEKFFGNK